MNESNIEMPQGPIKPDSDFGKAIGFTTDAGFRPYSYLYGEPENNRIWISLVVAIKKGAFRQMIENIEAMGLIFRVPTPLPRMLEICKKQGWKKEEMKFEDMDGEYYTNEGVEKK